MILELAANCTTRGCWQQHPFYVKFCETTCKQSPSCKSNQKNYSYIQKHVHDQSSSWQSMIIIFHQSDHALWGIFPPTKIFQPLNVLLPDILFFRDDRNTSIGRLTSTKLRKKSSFRSFFGPYFPAFGLNTDLKYSQFPIRTLCKQYKTAMNIRFWKVSQAANHACSPLI